MPTTGRFNLVQLGSIYFTNTGLVTGRPCKTQVTGIDALKITNGIQVIKALSGKPYLQVSDAQKGLPVDIKYESMEQSVFNSVVSAIQTAVTGLTTLSLTITGDTGTFSLTVVPGEQPVTFSGEFNNLRIKNGAFHFLTA